MSASLRRGELLLWAIPHLLGGVVDRRQDTGNGNDLCVLRRAPVDPGGYDLHRILTGLRISMGDVRALRAYTVAKLPVVLQYRRIGVGGSGMKIDEIACLPGGRRMQAEAGCRLWDRCVDELDHAYRSRRLRDGQDTVFDGHDAAPQYIGRSIRAVRLQSQRIQWNHAAA